MDKIKKNRNYTIFIIIKGLKIYCFYLHKIEILFKNHLLLKELKMFKIITK